MTLPRTTARLKESVRRGQRKNSETLSVTVDGQEPEVIKPFVKGTTFSTMVNENNKLINMFRFKVVLNRLFIGEEGIICLLKEEFKLEKSEHILLGPGDFTLCK